jgi:hypothetical protein
MTKKQFLIKQTLIFLAIGAVFGSIFFVVRNHTNPGKYLEQRKAEANEGYKEMRSGAYLGDLVAATFQGKGRFEFRSGETYTGEWSQGFPHGEGMFYYNNAGIYKGRFADGMRSGNGTFTWPEGFVYQGNWRSDKPSGEGTLASPEGLVLVGTFDGNGQIEGWLQGKNQDGEFGLRVIASRLTSSVKVAAKSGQHYEGTYQNETLSGQGTVTYPNGDKYIGDLVNGVKEGQGRYIWAKNGSVYSGAWQKDKMNGAGVYYYDGNVTLEKLSGKFVNNYPSGTCLYTDKYSVTYTTVWSKGKCTKVSRKK